MVLFWFDPWEIFIFAHTRVWTGDLWRSLVLQSTYCATVTSGFHLWQFQVLKSGAEGLVVVLFWLDLWEILFLSRPEFELGTSGYLVLQSTTVQQWFLVFTSDNFRYWSLVQRDWWWYTSDWTCERFSFCPHESLNWGPLDDSRPEIYHCATVTSDFHLWQSQVLNSGAERLVVVLFWLDPWKIFFLSAPGFKMGTSGSLVLNSTSVPQWFLVFTSDNFRYWTLVADGLVMVLFWLDLWEINFVSTPGFELGTSASLILHSSTVLHGTFWFSPMKISGIELWCRGFGGGIVLIGPVRDFHFVPTPGFEVGTSGSLVLHSYHCATCAPSNFHLWKFQVLNSVAEGLVVVLFWLDLWEILHFAHTRVWTGDLWISSPALYHCATWWTSGFHLWQFQVFNPMVQRD